MGVKPGLTQTTDHSLMIILTYSFHYIFSSVPYTRPPHWTVSKLRSPEFLRISYREEIFNIQGTDYEDKSSWT